MKYNSALKFTGGASHYVDFGTPTAWTNLSTITLFMKVYFTTWVSFGRMFRTSNEDGPLWTQLNAITDGFQFRRRRSSPPHDLLSTGDTGLTIGKWWDCAATYDFNASSGQRWTYYQGDQKTPITQQIQGGTASGALNDDSDETWQIGHSSSSAFDGGMQVFQIFDRVLSENELRDVQDGSMLRCVGSYLLGTNGPNVVLDRSGNRNHGVITGAKIWKGPPLKRKRRTRAVKAPAPPSGAGFPFQYYYQQQGGL